MSGSSVAFTESLLQEEPQRTARCGKKAFVVVAFIIGLGFAALLSNETVPVTYSTINMAWQSMQARPSQFMQPEKALPMMQPPKALPFMQPSRASALPGPLSRTNGLATGFRANALPNPSALAGPGVGWNHVTDLRNTQSFSPGQKCVYVDKHASLCGNLVVLRSTRDVRADAKPSTPNVDVEEITKKIKDKIDGIEDKPQAALYAGGALVALYFTNSIISSVDGIPLLPKLMELVGLGYSVWFGYRYLLTESSRTELMAEIDEVKKKVSGEN